MSDEDMVLVAYCARCHGNPCVCVDAPWSTRISAAIAKAERLVPVTGAEGPRGFITITATEVALAKALFKAHHEAVYKILRVGWDEHESWADEGDEPCTHCAPLHAFTEKVEQLGN